MNHSTSHAKYTRQYRSRHPLAEYAISQIETLELRAQDIIKAMGYPTKHTLPACERLRHVLSNQYLGLDGSYRDGYFTADAFLAKLFTVLEMPYELFAEDTAQIKYELNPNLHALPKYSLRDDINIQFDNTKLLLDATNDYKFTVQQKKTDSA
ncbi:hypothetical protein ACTXGO_14495 [Psychrobacter sp. T6-1]|uniref:hypothetical protein n=1 Tax=Psychrobacter sp. T6-1 TaxID=3457447 RepID=UPI003FD3D395